MPASKGAPKGKPAARGPGRRTGSRHTDAVCLTTRSTQATHLSPRNRRYISLFVRLSVPSVHLSVSSVRLFHPSVLRRVRSRIRRANLVCLVCLPVCLSKRQTPMVLLHCDWDSPSPGSSYRCKTAGMRS